LRRPSRTGFEPAGPPFESGRARSFFLAAQLRALLPGGTYGQEESSLSAPRSPACGRVKLPVPPTRFSLPPAATCGALYRKGGFPVRNPGPRSDRRREPAGMRDHLVVNPTRVRPGHLLSWVRSASRSPIRQVIEVLTSLHDRASCALTEDRLMLSVASTSLS